MRSLLTSIFTLLFCLNAVSCANRKPRSEAAGEWGSAYGFHIVSTLSCDSFGEYSICSAVFERNAKKKLISLMCKGAPIEYTACQPVSSIDLDDIK